MTEQLNDPALSYEKGPTGQPLLEKTIGDMLDEIVEQYPDNEALISRHQDLRYTYREFLEEVNKCACALLTAGIRKGDRVGVWSPNYAQWVIIQFATGKIGAILVNINPSYRLHELEYVLTQSGCSALLLAPHFKSSNYTAMVQELAPELEHCQPGMLVSAKLPNLKIVVRGKEEEVPGMWTWDEFMALSESVTQEAMREQQRRLSPFDPINIQYTSGTTGFPKGATLSHYNILNNGYFVGEIMKFTDKDRLVIPVPLYHCFGMVLGNLACVTHGATMIYPGDSFVAEKVLAAVEEEKATALHGVPTMFIAKLEHEDFNKYDLRSLRTGLMAGSPCPIEVMKKVTTDMHLREMEIAYGMTETSPVSTQTAHDAPLDKRVGTVGRVHPHLEIKITDPESGKTVPRGTTGEFCTRGYSVMLGYWNDPQQTSEAIDAEGWMHTSDLAVMDEEGWVNIVGRIKDMIIRGGENVYPREIEEFFYTNPKVSDVQVIGVPDVKYGEEIMAWIKLAEGENADIDELREFCKGKIAHFKIPRYIKLVDDFPMTVTGKIQKFVMRDQSIEELGLQDAANVETHRSSMNCRQCGSDSLKLIYTQGNKHEFEFYRCRECYLVNLDLTTGLDQTKYDHKGDQSASHFRKETQSQERTWQHLKNNLPELPGKRLLDIGCGNAHMLELARTEGWEIAGIEILPNLAALASRKLNVEVVTSDIQNYQPHPGEEYDLIVMRHVFEHIPDGLAVIRKCLDMLARGGVIYLELPNIDSFSLVLKRWLLRRGLAKKQYRPDYIPGHCNEYGRRSLHKLAEITGLRLEQWGTYSSRPALDAFYRLFPVATKGWVALIRE